MTKMSDSDDGSGIEVTNPLTRRPLYIRDFSNARNRTVWNMIQLAKAEDPYFRDGKHVNAMKKVLADCFRKGYFLTPPEKHVPLRLWKAAWEYANLAFGLPIPGMDNNFYVRETSPVLREESSLSPQRSRTQEEEEEQEILPCRENNEAGSSTDLPINITMEDSSSSDSSYYEALERGKKRRFNQAYHSSNEIPGVIHKTYFEGVGAEYTIGMTFLNEKECTVPHNIYAHLAAIQMSLKKVLLEISDRLFQYRVNLTYQCIMRKPLAGRSYRPVEPGSNQQRLSHLFEAPSINEDEDRLVDISTIDTKSERPIVGPITSISKLISFLYQLLLTQFTEFQGQGSGYTWVGSVHLKVFATHFKGQLTLGHGVQSRDPVASAHDPMKRPLSIEEMIELENYRGRLPSTPPTITQSLPPIEESDKGKEKVTEQEEEEEPAEGEPSRKRHRDGDLKGGFYIPSPKWLKGKQCIINVYTPKSGEDVDNKCFALALLRGLYRVRTNATQPRDLIPHLHEIKLPKGVDYPFICRENTLAKIEELNREKFTFSLFYIGDRKGDVCTLYESKIRSKWKQDKANGLKPEPIDVPHLRLGFLDARDSHIDERPDHGVNGHYVLITRFSALLNHGESNHREYCERCLTPHYPGNIESHEKDCYAFSPTKVNMPKEGSKDHYLQFSNWKHLLPAPFVIYADIEALLEQVQASNGEMDQSTSTYDPSVSTKHTPSGWVYYIHSRYEHHANMTFGDEFIEADNGVRPLREPRHYFGPNSIKHFYNHIIQDVARCLAIIEKDQLDWDQDANDKIKFDEATHCHICERSLDGDKVLDHDHHTGKYRGAAHNNCNLWLSDRKNTVIPVFFHNFRGYDSYHLLKGLYGCLDKFEKITCIAKSMEKFTSITMDNIRFVDSLAFLGASLDSLVSTLYRSCLHPTESEQSARIGYRFAPVLDFFDSDDVWNPVLSQGEKWEIIKKDMFEKGPYPYTYMKDWASLEETSLPEEKKYWQSDLGAKEELSDEEFQVKLNRAKKMWHAWGCKNLKDFTRMYCTLDVLQLASVFEEFRNGCIQQDNYRIDPAHYLTVPSFAWSAMMLRIATKYPEPIVIENITEQEMLMMVERGIRGGMCQIMEPFAQANYPGMSSPLLEDNSSLQYDRNKPETRILYLDANNLYGKAMQHYLPIGNFKWVFDAELLERGSGEAEWFIFCDPNKSSKYLVDFVNTKLDEQLEKGYLLEVDLDYPPELHGLHNNYPLAPENKVPQPSDFTIEEAMRLGGKNLANRYRGQGGQRKLILDLTNKRRYVVHYKLLAFYLQHGLKLVKIHRAFSFRQIPWLKDFVLFNTKKRQEAKLAKEDFKVVLFKLVSNSTYGKTIEQVRRRKNIQMMNAVNTSVDHMLAYSSSPFTKHFHIIIPDQFAIMEQHKTKCVMNRPVLTGMSILELSKLEMYSFHYDVMMKYLGPPEDNEAQDKPLAVMLYTDTDSLIYKITLDPINGHFRSVHEAINFIQHNEQEEQPFDLSENLPKDHPIFHDYGFGTLNPQDERSARILGKMKFDVPFDIVEFIAVRPKMYSILMDYGNLNEEYVKALQAKGQADRIKSTKKGIPMGMVVEHEKYRHVLQGGEKLPKVTFKRITKTKELQLITKEESKDGIAGADDKSYWFNHTRCLRYGHKDLIAN